MKVGDIDIIECWIEIGYSERMYHAQVRMFDIPHLDNRQLQRHHCMAFGIPRIDDDVEKYQPIPGKLFTNASAEAPDWVLSPEGKGGAKRIMAPWPVDFHTCL